MAYPTRPGPPARPPFPSTSLTGYGRVYVQAVDAGGAPDAARRNHKADRAAVLVVDLAGGGGGCVLSARHGTIHMAVTCGCACARAYACVRASGEGQAAMDRHVARSQQWTTGGTAPALPPCVFPQCTQQAAVAGTHAALRLQPNHETQRCQAGYEPALLSVTYLQCMASVACQPVRHCACSAFACKP